MDESDEQNVRKQEEIQQHGACDRLLQTPKLTTTGSWQVVDLAKHSSHSWKSTPVLCSPGVVVVTLRAGNSRLCLLPTLDF